MITELYVDGGVIGTNPSAIGGTYAVCLVFDDGHTWGYGAVISTSDMGGDVTNNQTEMLAFLKGLAKLPDDFKGTIYSDSAITLGRAFSGWKWKNIPEWMHRMYREQRARFVHWDDIKYVLLDGHPTKAQLHAGIGKRGHPVSEHNVWCDDTCRIAGETYMATIGENIPTFQDLVEL